METSELELYTTQELIAELMRRLDSVPREARRPVKVFPIRNRSVSELHAVLVVQDP